MKRDSTNTSSRTKEGESEEKTEARANPREKGEEEEAPAEDPRGEKNSLLRDPPKPQPPNDLFVNLSLKMIFKI